LLSPDINDRALPGFFLVRLSASHRAAQGGALRRLCGEHGAAPDAWWCFTCVRSKCAGRRRTSRTQTQPACIRGITVHPWGITVHLPSSHKRPFFADLVVTDHQPQKSNLVASRLPSQIKLGEGSGSETACKMSCV